MSDSYPALIELISRLEGKDKKTCELALYCLNQNDRREKKLRREIEYLKREIEYRVLEEKEEADGRDGHENRPTDSVANSEG